MSVDFRSLKVGDAFLISRGGYYGIVLEVLPDEITWQWYSMDGVESRTIHKIRFEEIRVRAVYLPSLMKELL